MPKRVSLKYPICICCQTNRSPNRKQLFCKKCFIFIHQKIGIQASDISRKLNLSYNTKEIKSKCTFCESNAMIIYKNYETKKKYYICKMHHDKWLAIGCQLGDFANML